MPGMTMGFRSVHVHLGTSGDAMLRKRYVNISGLYPFVLGFHP